MMQILAALALLLALDPAPRSLPCARRQGHDQGHDQAALCTAHLDAAAHRLSPRDDVNSLGSAPSNGFTMIGPNAIISRPPSSTPFARVSRRWLLAAHLLL